MRIDSHQHFWKFDPVRDAWIDQTMRVLQRDFLPQDLEPLLSGQRIDGCVAVQADQSERETAFLLELAGKHPFIRKVVGWVDLASHDIEFMLATWKKNATLAGFRHILQAEPPEKMSDPSFRHGISKLEEYGYTYDLLIYPRHLQAALNLVDTFPNQPFVVDHVAKPSIREGIMQPWETQLKLLAERPHVYCKLSGLVTEANLKAWEPTDLRPYMDVALEAFGSSRLMFGSDWPVCLLASRYEKVVDVTDQFVAPLSSSEREMIMGGTASHFYGITN